MGHAEQMDAKAYHRQFIVPWYPKSPGDELVGAVIEYVEPRERDRKDWVPGWLIQTKGGDLRKVVGYQTRLAAEMVEASPVIGEVVKITYHGEAKKAAPGMNKAKEFTVAVRRRGAQPQERPSGEALGEVTGENAPGAGS